MLDHLVTGDITCISLILIFTSAKDSGVLIKEIWGSEPLSIKETHHTVLVSALQLLQRQQLVIQHDVCVTEHKNSPLGCKKRRLKKQKQSWTARRENKVFCAALCSDISAWTESGQEVET